LRFNRGGESAFTFSGDFGIDQRHNGELLNNFYFDLSVTYDEKLWSGEERREFRMQIYLRMKIKSTADFHAGEHYITSATIIALSPTNSVSLKVGEGGRTERFLSFRNHVG